MPSTAIPGTAMTCPLCGKPAEAVYRPFCSRRCADLDLGKWFNEAYRIPAEPSDEDQDEDQDEDPGADAPENGRGALAH